MSDVSILPYRDASSRVTEGDDKLRFAVATFDSLGRTREAVEHLSLEGFRNDAFSCLGLYRVLIDSVAKSEWPVAADIQELLFPCNSQRICCTAGPVARRLAERLRAGSPHLQAALGYWLIPRHAAHFQDAVERGEIILWVQLFDSDGEREAYRSLLAKSSNSVGVHDLDGRP